MFLWVYVYAYVSIYKVEMAFIYSKTSLWFYSINCGKAKPSITVGVAVRPGCVPQRQPI